MVINPSNQSINRTHGLTKGFTVSAKKRLRRRDAFSRDIFTRTALSHTDALTGLSLYPHTLRSRPDGGVVSEGSRERYIQPIEFELHGYSDSGPSTSRRKSAKGNVQSA